MSRTDDRPPADRRRSGPWALVLGVAVVVGLVCVGVNLLLLAAVHEPLDTAEPYINGAIAAVGTVVVAGVVRPWRRRAPRSGSGGGRGRSS